MYGGRQSLKNGMNGRGEGDHSAQAGIGCVTPANQAGQLFRVVAELDVFLGALVCHLFAKMCQHRAARACMPMRQKALIEKALIAR